MNYIELNGISLLSYLDLNEEQSREVLDARNHSAVRELMFSDNEISWDNHLEFIESLKRSTHYYYAVFLDDRYLGSINLKIRMDETPDWGLFLSPSFLGTGLGVVLEYLALELFVLVFNTTTLTSLVKEINVEAISMHNGFGFAVVDHTDGYVRMDITREVWKQKRSKLKKLVNRLLKK
jgi:UDP-4-amino-4,6-dideoxy-N-acetyl-beta-L-altrosamine N-acetyltransferase